MRIAHIEIGNFRKLKAVRVDFAADKTVFVGANNSGKTSAMVALRHFLVDASDFAITDFTVSYWQHLNATAEGWERAAAEGTPIPEVDWSDYLPYLDVWLHVELKELHYVKKLLSTLDWSGGLLGVRLRFEPTKQDDLQRDYLKARAQIAALKESSVQSTSHVTTDSDDKSTVLTAITDSLSAPCEAKVAVSLWPQSMTEFLERRMRGMFKVRGYLLDPAKLKKPVDGIALPQPVSSDEEPLEGNPFTGLIEIDEISAQRGFGQVGKARRTKDEGSSSDQLNGKEGRRLSTQLRSYYINHLDPYETPEPKDLEALLALEAAGGAFDARLKACFASALNELEGLGYPGVTDPKLTISTRLRAMDGLNHDAAVQYEVSGYSPSGNAAYRLPEGSNGLGYQNLVSMVFGLMSFRDAWMRVGKAGKSSNAELAHTPPLHLVLIEEPEAHLHAQVQQVFIKQAYAVLRNHKDLKGSKALTTQLVVSTHSSHVAHACDFASLRYFRRLPAPADPGAVPIASVVNLSEVFGAADQTERFVTRYLKASHCDLFFADGVVLVEGPAERLLVPHFVEERVEFEYLRRCYISWLEIGGSHAHRLRQLIEHLGISTLIITDIDAKDATTGASVPPRRGANQTARNETLRTWVPAQDCLDALLDLAEARKLKQYSGGCGVRVAYQCPVAVCFKTELEVEALPNTFEDALLYHNLQFFSNREGTGLVTKCRKAIEEASDVTELAQKMHDALKIGGKAEFALDLLYSDDIALLAVPAYIRDGLLWLIAQLKRKEREMVGLVVEPLAAAA